MNRGAAVKLRGRRWWSTFSRGRSDTKTQNQTLKTKNLQPHYCSSFLMVDDDLVCARGGDGAKMEIRAPTSLQSSSTRVSSRCEDGDWHRRVYDQKSGIEVASTPGIRNPHKPDFDTFKLHVMIHTRFRQQINGRITAKQNPRSQNVEANFVAVFAINLKIIFFNFILIYYCDFYK